MLDLFTATVGFIVGLSITGFGIGMLLNLDAAEVITSKLFGW